MSWLGHLNLDYRLDGDRTIALDRHDGPLRVLQRLYPEGPGICHHVLVHPPGGIAGGDELDVHAQLGTGTHALITTPGATRFYRSAGPMAVQRLVAQVGDHARLEWLPLETIAYRSCRGENAMRFELAPTAEMMGWDVLALGLPAAEQAFDSAAHPDGEFTQQIELPGIWLERGCIKARDQHLLDSPLGWAGLRVSGTLWLATGSAMARDRREALLDEARRLIGQVDPSLGTVHAGATSVHEQTVVVRVLAERVEPLMNLLTAIRGAWRTVAWQLDACPPRVWRT